MIGLLNRLIAPFPVSPTPRRNTTRNCRNTPTKSKPGTFPNDRSTIKASFTSKKMPKTPNKTSRRFNSTRLASSTQNILRASLFSLERKRLSSPTIRKGSAGTCRMTPTTTSFPKRKVRASKTTKNKSRRSQKLLKNQGKESLPKTLRIISS